MCIHRHHQLDRTWPPTLGAHAPLTALLDARWGGQVVRGPRCQPVTEWALAAQRDAVKRTSSGSNRRKARSTSRAFSAETGGGVPTRSQVSQHVWIGHTCDRPFDRQRSVQASDSDGEARRRSQASGRGPVGRQLVRRSLTSGQHSSSSDSQGSDANSPALAASAMRRQGWSGGASANSVMRKRPRAAHVLSYEPSSIPRGGDGGGPGGGPVRSSTYMEPPSPLTTVWGATAKRRGFATMELEHAHALLHQPPCTPRLSPEHAEPHADPPAHDPAEASATVPVDCGPSPGPAPPPETVAAILMSLTQPPS